MSEDEWVAVTLREVRAPVEADGVLAPTAEQHVQTGFSAAAVRFVIASYAVRTGDRVRAGDVLATLVSPQGDVRLAQEQSMLHLLESQLLDAQRAALRESGPAADLGVRAAESRVAQSRAATEALRIGLGRAVCSPIAGIVANLPAVSTESGYPQTIAHIVQTDPLRLEVALPPGDTLPRQGAVLSVAIGPLRIDGRVRGIAPLADADGRVVLVIEVPNGDGALPAGLRASVTVDVGRWHALVVPETAIVRSPRGPVVWTTDPAGPRVCAVRVVGEVDGDVAVTGVVEGQPVLRHPPPAPVPPPSWEE